MKHLTRKMIDYESSYPMKFLFYTGFPKSLQSKFRNVQRFVRIPVGAEEVRLHLARKNKGNWMIKQYTISVSIRAQC